MPASRTRDKNRGLLLEAVGLSLLLEADAPTHGIVQIDLALDHVGPGRAVGVLEIRHEGRGAAVERVDHHLAIGRPRDLDAAIEHILRLRRDGPVAGAHLRRLGKKIGQFAGVELALTCGAVGEQTLAARFESAVQLGDEAQGGRRQYRSVSGNGGPMELDSVRQAHTVFSLNRALYGENPGPTTNVKIAL